MRNAAAADGKLWELWFTSVPAAAHTADYIADALAGQLEGHVLLSHAFDALGCQLVGFRTVTKLPVPASH